MSGSTGTVAGPVPYLDPARRAASRRRAVRGAIVATGSLLVFVALVVVWVSRLPGWPAVQASFFDGEVFLSSFGPTLRALILNIKIFLVAELLILPLGLVVALCRRSSAPVLFPLRVVATVYTDVFRGTPTLLVVLLLGFGVPALDIPGLTPDPVVWGGLALVLSYGAYVGEVFRAGIVSVHPSQAMAARSLALSQWQTSRYVVLPQAVRRVVPPLLNDFVSLQKDTALVGILGPIEALRQAQIDSYDLANFTPYVTAAVLFIAMTIPLARYTDWLAARQERRTSVGGVR
ncbi:MAG TPA: amino acid ABC transporter permease [Candidatus Nanopelagicales bacterium]|nr:amino acid ABC transporter permease [Candidatus Nanopelagicales bacterium]